MAAGRTPRRVEGPPSLTLPDEFLNSLPNNLSHPALRDFVAILRRSHKEFGLGTARETRDRLLERCRAIQSGAVLPDVRKSPPGVPHKGAQAAPDE